MIKRSEIWVLLSGPEGELEGWMAATDRALLSAELRAIGYPDAAVEIESLQRLNSHLATVLNRHTFTVGDIGYTLLRTSMLHEI